MIGVALINMSKQKPIIVEKEVVKYIEIDNCKVACTPCIDEPQFEKCEFNFAYVALKDKFDIYGNTELKKGDIYVFRDYFTYDWDYFCADTDAANHCYGYKLILNKDLFKPIN